MATILVTGANGFVGSHITPALLDDGHRLVALVRSEGAGAAVLRRLSAERRARVVLHIGDVTRPASLGPALEGVDATVHLAAIPRDRDGGTSLRLVNTEGTRNVVVAMREAGVRRLVHMGAMGVADDPALHYASSKAKAEAIVRDSGLEWTILKPSLQWGERDGFFNILAGLVRKSPGIVPMPGRGRSRFQPIAVTDVAWATALVLARSDMVGRTLELGGPRWWTYREILAEVMRGMGVRRAILPMPVPVIALVARVSEAIRLPFPVASDQLRQLKLDNIAADLAGVEGTLGFAPLDMAGRLGYLRRKPRDQDPAADEDAATAATVPPSAT